MHGENACTGFHPIRYFEIVLTSIIVVGNVLMMLWAIYLLISLKRNRQSLTNAAGSTLISTVFSSFCAAGWFSQYIFTAATQSGWYLSVMCYLVFLPTTAVFASSAFLNVSLMWIKVAAASRSLKSAGVNLSRRMVVFVFVFCVIFFVAMVICCGVLQSPTIGAGVAVLFLLIIMGLYLVGGHKLVVAMRGSGHGSTSVRLKRILRTSRLMVGALAFFILMNILCE